MKLLKLNKPLVFTNTFATYTATRIIREGGRGAYLRLVIVMMQEAYVQSNLDLARTTKEKIKRFKNELQFSQ